VPTVKSILHPNSTILELLILDQSDDNLTEVALAPFRQDARVRYIRLTTKGHGVSLNYGLLEAKGDIVACTDDDCEVDLEWPSHHVHIMTDFPRVAVTFGNVLPVEHDARSGFIPSYFVRRDRLIPTIWQKPSARGIGANLAVRRNVVLAMGGFDPECGPGGKFHSAGDGDIALRALLAGHHVYEVEGSVVLHYGFRNWEQGRALTCNAWTGIGAAFAKPLKCGRWEALPIPLFEFFVHALLPFLWATITFRNRKGWMRVRYFIKGFVEGWRSPIDRVKMVYLSGSATGASSSCDIIDILKLDIEGRETNVFQSADTSWINKTRVIVVEIHGAGAESAICEALKNRAFTRDKQHESSYSEISGPFLKRE
jgi:glycosyltransferase involved in cell wall biosynthesis